MHILTAISHHGFGHVAQVCPILNALKTELPSVRLTLWSGTAESVLKRCFTQPFGYENYPVDVGIAMQDAIQVLPEVGYQHYVDFHQNWDEKVDKLTEKIIALKPDLIFADVPYQIGQAAMQAGVPAIALCSLNWLDIFRAYCRAFPLAENIIGQIKIAYNQFDLFLKPLPSMEMPDIARTRNIGPLARVGYHRRAEIEQRLGLKEGNQLILVVFGGLPFRLPMEQWPEIPHVVWLVESSWQVHRPDCFSFDVLGIPFIDILASVDLVLGKPGYGVFVEASCHGIPILYQDRPGWPEAPALIEFAKRYNYAVEISQEQLATGDFAETLECFRHLPKPEKVKPTGVAEAVTLLREWLP